MIKQPLAEFLRPRPLSMDLLKRKVKHNVVEGIFFENRSQERREAIHPALAPDVLPDGNALTRRLFRLP